MDSEVAVRSRADIDFGDDAERRQLFRIGMKCPGRFVVITTLASWSCRFACSSAALQARRGLARAARSARPSERRAVVIPARVSLGEFCQMNARRFLVFAAGVIPRLFGGMRNNRCQKPCQVIVQPCQHELGRPAVGLDGRIGVKAVFDDVEIEARQLDDAELVDPLIDPVKLESFVSFPDVTDNLVELAEQPAVDFV